MVAMGSDRRAAAGAELPEIEPCEPCLRAVEPPAVRAVPECVALLDADGPGELAESASAAATAHVAKIPAPTPKATASPPTRPTQLEAVVFIAPHPIAKNSQQTPDFFSARILVPLRENNEA